MTSPPQYDNIATNYHEEIKGAAYYEKLVNPTIRHMLGDVKGKAILDLACGDGVRTVMLKRLGAEKVVGVDISAKMIDIAKREAERQNVDIDFIVEDCSREKEFGKFDIVSAFFLVNYAATREEFLRMCRLINTNLKTGGKFVGISSSVHTAAKDLVHAQKHGFYIQQKEDPQDGDVRTVTFKFGAPFTIHCYHMKPETFEWAFKEAGFSHFEWVLLDLFESNSIEDREYYKDVMAHPNITGFMAW